LEKRYLRLTSVPCPFSSLVGRDDLLINTNTQVHRVPDDPLLQAPNPEKVRPLHILRQTLALLKKKWLEECDYTYICDQFKSMRQDLTVRGSGRLTVVENQTNPLTSRVRTSLDLF